MAYLACLPASEGTYHVPEGSITWWHRWSASGKECISWPTGQGSLSIHLKTSTFCCAGLSCVSSVRASLCVIDLASLEQSITRGGFDIHNVYIFRSHQMRIYLIYVCTSCALAQIIKALENRSCQKASCCKQLWITVIGFKISLC